MTQQQLTVPDGDAIERLLNQLAGRTDGLVEMGTLVCLGRIPVDRHAFLLQRLDEVKALLADLRRVVEQVGALDADGVEPILRGLAPVEESLRDAFLVLEQFRSLPLEAVHLATRTIANGYDSLRVQIQCLGHALGVSIRYWEGSRAEHEDYYRRILDGLYDLCCRERASEPASTPIP